MYMGLDFRDFLAETLGTLFLVFTVGVSQGTAIAVGGILWKVCDNGLSLRCAV